MIVSKSLLRILAAFSLRSSLQIVCFYVLDRRSFQIRYAVVLFNMVWPCTCEGKFCFSADSWFGLYHVAVVLTFLRSPISLAELPDR